MDIQSSKFNAIFVLFPVFVVNWITPVKPATRAHGGVPRSIYDDVIKGLLCVIDPWTELQQRSLTMAAYDSVKLYVNDDADHVASATVQLGDEQKRIELDVPHGRLVEGVNRLHYVVTRLSGNAEPSRDLFVLYYPLAPYNLKLNVPSTVITPALAAQGVTFSFTYNALRAYDLIRLRIGNKTFTYEVPDPATPPSITLYTDDFKAIGDGPTQASFLVTDQLTNTGTSANTMLDIQVGKVEPLLAPKIVEAGGNSSLDPLTARDHLTAEVNYAMQPGDKLTVTWSGAPGTPAEGSHTTAEVPAGVQPQQIPLPNSVVPFSFAKTVTVTYSVIRAGQPPLLSQPLPLDIQPLSLAGFTPPQLLEAPNNGEGPELDVGQLTPNGQFRVRHFPFIAVNQPVWMLFRGTHSDGSAYEKYVWDSSFAYVNQGWITNGYFDYSAPNADLKNLKDGTPLTLEFRVGFGRSADIAQSTVFPLRTYTVGTTVADTFPSFVNLPYVIAPAGRVKNIVLNLSDDNGTPVPRGELTLTLPAGTTYAGGGTGTRGFITDPNGQVIVEGVKGSAIPGGYTLLASSGGRTVSAPLTINHLPPIGNIGGVDWPRLLAISPDGVHLYGCSSEAQSVFVIDTAKQTVIRKIYGFTRNYGVAVSPDGNRLYVANSGSNSVSVRDTATYTSIGAISSNPSMGIAVSPDGTRLYVANYSSTSVSVIDIATNTHIGTISDLQFPYGVAVSPDGARLYVTHADDNLVSVIDTLTLTVISTITGFIYPFGVAVSPDGARLYVANTKISSVSVIDTGTQIPIRTISGFRNPSGIAVSPDGNRVYVSDTSGNLVSVVDGK